MSRKITIESCAAFEAGHSFKKQNTEVSSRNGKLIMYLHGNEIARIEDDGGISITDAGWQTATTKERLNGLSGVEIKQKNFQWHLNGAKWDGEWIRVL